jgi:hypothetical protein
MVGFTGGVIPAKQYICKLLKHHEKACTALYFKNGEDRKYL